MPNLDELTQAANAVVAAAAVAREVAGKYAAEVARDKEAVKALDTTVASLRTNEGKLAAVKAELAKYIAERDAILAEVARLKAKFSA